MVSGERLTEPFSLPRRFRCRFCGSGNYYVWGTSINGVLKVEVRCMRCGRVYTGYEAERPLEA